MDEPRVFLGSSGKQAKLLPVLTRGLEDIAHVEPWTTSFNPGTTTLGRLLELTRQVEFAAFVFARDWTTRSNPPSDADARTSGIYLRADSGDLAVLDGLDAARRAELIAERLKNRKAMTDV